MIFNESDLNKHWSLKSLEELGYLNRGKSKHRPRNDYRLFSNGTIPLVQTGDIKAANLFIYEAKEFYNEFGLNQSKLWDEGTLCITIAANIAETAILKTRMCFPDSIVGFTPYKGKTTSLYIHYLFTYIRYRIQNSVQGSIQDNINIDYLTRLKFRIPEFDTQQKIAKVLSDLDAKIELNNRINTELEAMAKLVYEYWFVQFDFPFDFASTPLSTGAQGKPDNDGKPYKFSGGKMVWNEELKREVPEGWEVKNIYDCSNVQYGYPFKTEFFNEETGVPVIRIRDILDNTVSNFSDEPKIDPKYRINVGDLLVGMDGNFHLNFWSKPDCYLNQRVVKFGETILSTMYLRYAIEPFIKLREKSVSRTTVGHLSDKDIRSINVLIPPKDILETSNSFFGNCLKKMMTNRTENQEISALRDWLLPMLMNGQVGVGEAEELVKEELGMVAEAKEIYQTNPSRG